MRPPADKSVPRKHRSERGRTTSVGYHAALSKPGIRIIEDRCVGCGLCVGACPFGAISIEDGKAVIDYDKCTICGACASICSTFEAIDFSVEETEQYTDAAVGDIWVFCEVEYPHASLAPVSRELLGLARRLADQLTVDVVGVILGSGISKEAALIAACGADKVIVADSAALAMYADDTYAAVLRTLIQKRKPHVVLGGATATGRALLPRLAVQLHTGLTADCTELTIDATSGLLQQTRPAFGGNILATITCEKHRPQMATVRPGVLPKPAPDYTRQGEVIPYTPPPALLQSRLTWLDFHPAASGSSDLREAEVIVACGYGVGGPEGVELVRRLAEAFGASLAASRSVVDAGWLDYSHQVGQTGTTVQPKLYIACGISGAIQHIVGMQNSDMIVAINNDPDAPIFQHADYAVPGNVFDVIPELLNLLSRTVRKSTKTGEKTKQRS